MTTRRSIWSEYTPYATLQDPAVLAELGRRRIELAVAVTPSLLPELAPVIRACRAAGVAVAVWPMLADTQGRWASAENAAPFCRFVRELLDALAEQGAFPDALALDLEPPIDRLRALMKGRLAMGGPHAPAEGTALLAALAAEARARGLPLLAAVVPTVAITPDAAASGWQRLLHTPVDALACERVSTMAYTSLLEGYSRRILRRQDARALLAYFAQGTRARFGARASVSLGAVGTGALGDEPVYRSPAELVDDVGIARAAGIEDLVLFNLDGALARPPLGAWLDALCDTPPAATPLPATLRVRLIGSLLRGAGHLGQRW